MTMEMKKLDISSEKKEMMDNSNAYREKMRQGLNFTGTNPMMLFVLRDMAKSDRQFANDVVNMIRSDQQMATKFAALLAANPVPAKELGEALSRSDLTSSDFDLMSFFKREHYGVPTYGWGLGAIGVAGLAYYFFKR